MTPKPQVFCFPCAGGNASFFDEIEKALPELELVKLEYPGHGTRYRETLCGSFDELADDMICGFKERYSGGEFALFGYSMGVVTLTEVLIHLLRTELPLPRRVFLAAHEPRTKSELEGFTPEETDEWVVDRTIRFGALPEHLLHNRAFWRLFLPLYRADYTMLSKYHFETLDLKTTIPATVFYSETDTPFEKIRLWKDYFVGECEFIRYEGRHFFIQQHLNEMADMIRSRIM